MIRLNKYLSLCGYCSRRKAEEYILEGKIKINGQVVKKLASFVEEGDKVVVCDEYITLNEKKIYLALNKPSGYVTTAKDELGRKCILDLVHEKERVYPVGRLDKDTEGLLILTNDGDVANDLMHPKKEVEKEYIAVVQGEITKEKIEELKNGVDIGDFVTSLAKVKQIKNDTLSITIHEGKNRQVKKMCEAVGLQVIYLRRIRIGNLLLGEIPLGKYHYLSKEELMKQIGK